MNDYSQDSKIAIIGMTGKFPKSDNIQLLWENLLNKKEGIQFFTNDEMIEAGIDPEIVNNPNHVPAAGILKDIELFDNAFFHYTPREAEILDPQHRLFLEYAWNALEDSGYCKPGRGFSVGVFAGVGANKYLSNILAHQKLLSILDRRQIEVSNDKDYVATRVSYKLNLTGPSLTIQTACSSSLVSVHVACQSLLNGECDLALAGGVSVLLFEKKGYIYVDGGIESPDGHCRCFDEKAEGTTFGDGVGVIVLKRLSEAIRDRDHIYAVISGSAVNNDGAGKIGYTAPGIDGQIQVVSEAIEFSGLAPDDIGYIEAHGTGTRLGDKIEIAALKEVFKERDMENKCYIGSIKANIGHLNTASGIAGLIKAALMVKNGIIPPQLDFNNPNPLLEIENSPLMINKAPVQWENNKRKRVAGISSFGIGGTNAHVVLEEPPASTTIKSEKEWQLLLVSGKTAEAFHKNYENLVNFIIANPDIELSNVAYTLQTGREHFPYRGYLLCNSGSNKNNTHKYRIIKEKNTPVHDEKSLMFLFYGMGAQYINMGKGVYTSEPLVKDVMDKCFWIVKNISKFDLKQVIYPEQTSIEQVLPDINNEPYASALVFIIQYSLALLWIHWGFSPTAMSGDYIGEYVCACLAKVFSLEDALKLIILKKELTGEIRLFRPSIRFISNRTNTWIDEKHALSLEYWKELSEGAVEFSKYSKELFNLKNPFYLGFSPDSIVKRLFKDAVGTNSISSVLPDAESTEPDYKVLQNCLGSLWLEEYGIDWQSFYGNNIPGRISLPTYAFSKQRYWLDKYGDMSRNAGKSLQAEIPAGTVNQKNDIRWIILSGDSDKDELVNKLQEHDQKYIIVEQGEWFSHQRKGRYSLDLKDMNQIEQLLSELTTKDLTILDDNTGSQNRLVNDFYGEQEHGTRSIAEKMCGILEELLGISPIAVNDNFIELGGDSVTAIQFASRAKQFNIDITHDQIFEFPTIEELLGNLDSKDKSIISEEAGEMCAFDNKYHYIEQADKNILDKALDISKVESVYPISFMQLLVLNHSILNSRSGNVNIISFRIKENINKGNLKNAWQRVVDRHPILRTGFMWRKISNPVQFVLNDVEVLITELDWSHSSEEIQERSYYELTLDEQRKNFKTDEVLKMRFYLIKLTEGSYQFIWVYQNSLFDGWSMNIIIKEFWRNYYQDNTKQHMQAMRNPLFLNYIKWLKSQNTQEARAFWIRELNDYEFLNLKSNADNGVSTVYKGDSRSITISQDEVKNIMEYSKKSQITLNTLFVGVWGIINSYLLKSEDVLIGIMSSGRVPEIDGIEEMVGLFTNSLPVCISYNNSGSIKEWFVELQKKLLNIRRYEYVTLLQISQWCKIPHDNLQTVINQRTLVYSNFPSDFSFSGNGEDVKVIHFDSIGQLQIPLRIFVTPGEQFTLKIEYDSNKYDQSFVEKLLWKLKALITDISETETIKEL